MNNLKFTLHQLVKIGAIVIVVLVNGCTPRRSESHSRPGAATPPKGMSEAEILRGIRSHLEQLVIEGRFSGAVLLAQGDRILFQHAYGFADRAARVPNKVDTPFALASVTKVFTAAAILQLAQARKFSLDDTLIKVLPDYPNKEAASKITICQLLTHTSGLCNLFDRLLGLDFEKYQTPESFLPLFVNDPLLFSPGTKNSYSNAGYLVLGLIIARLSGQSYEDYVHQHVFKLAGMTNSGCTTGDTRGLNAIGGAHSTVGDLLRFSRALQNGKLLNKEYTDLHISGGAGMRAQSINGVRVVGHDGGAPGMSTSFEMHPERGYTVVVLSTQDGAAPAVRDRLRAALTSGD